MALDWTLVGDAIGMIATGALAYVLGKGKREVKGAEEMAERDVIVLLRQEVERLSARQEVERTAGRAEVERLFARVTALESREGRLIRHVYRLEGLMRAKDIEPPPFEIDGQPISAGGTI